MKLIVMPYCSHAVFTSSSAVEPPGCVTKVLRAHSFAHEKEIERERERERKDDYATTPRRAIWSIESRKGKNASDEHDTPDRCVIHSFFSAAVKGSGIVVKFCSHTARSCSVKSSSLRCRLIRKRFSHLHVCVCANCACRQRGR